MVQVYSADDVHARLPWHVLADALERAYRAGAQVPLRHTHALSPSEILLLMPAWNDTLIVTKLVTVMPAAAHTVQATLLVLDRSTGEPLACMDGEAVTLRRTAAVSAVAARHLARPDTRRFLLVGTGRLAPWMARAHFALRPGLQEVAVWGRDGAAARALAESLALEGLPAVAVQDLPSAAQAADIVCCATTATAPVVQGAWLRAGTHLDLVGAFRPDMREVDDAAVLRARIVVDGPGALVEAGDLAQPLANGCITRAHVAGDLTDLLCGRLPVRSDPLQDPPQDPLQEPSQDPPRDLSLFKSVGMALQDLAAAQAVLTLG